MYGTYKPYKNKRLKGEVKPFLFNNQMYTKKGQMQTVQITAGNRGEEPPRLMVTPRQVKETVITANEMHTIRKIS